MTDNCHQLNRWFAIESRITRDRLHRSSFKPFLVRLVVFDYKRTDWVVLPATVLLWNSPWIHNSKLKTGSTQSGQHYLPPSVYYSLCPFGDIAFLLFLWPEPLRWNSGHDNSDDWQEMTFSQQHERLTSVMLKQERSQASVCARWPAARSCK